MPLLPWPPPGTLLLPSPVRTISSGSSCLALAWSRVVVSTWSEGGRPDDDGDAGVNCGRILRSGYSVVGELATSSRLKLDVEEACLLCAGAKDDVVRSTGLRSPGHRGCDLWLEKAVVRGFLCVCVEERFAADCKPGGPVLLSMIN